MPSVLPRAARLRRPDDFRRTVRTGVRVSRPTVVLHADSAPAQAGVRVGFVVAKAVGNAVVRNQVKRRLRHLAGERIGSTPAGTDLVVRALPRAGSNRESLRADLPSAWAQAVTKLQRRRAGPGRPGEVSGS